MWIPCNAHAVKVLPIKDTVTDIFIAGRLAAMHAEGILICGGIIISY